MTTPTLTPVPTPSPNSSQSDPVFQAAVEARLVWEESFVSEINEDVLPFIEEKLEQVAATALTGDLPDLTGQVGNLLAVVSAATPSGAAVGFLGLLPPALMGLGKSSLVTLSGSSVIKTGIPSDANWVEITFSQVSLSADGSITVRARVAGANVTTGYNSPESLIFSATAGATAYTDRFPVYIGIASQASTGSIRLTRHGTGNIWIAQGGYALESPAVGWGGIAGRVSLSGALDGIAFIATAGTFDSGTIGFNWGY